MTKVAGGGKSVPMFCGKQDTSEERTKVPY